MQWQTKPNGTDCNDQFGTKDIGLRGPVWLQTYCCATVAGNDGKSASSQQLSQKNNTQ
jgi:hypothetical protein